MSTQDRKAREFGRRGQEILDAALALFEADDWEDVTVDEIAEKAEVSKGTIYKHFVSKDEIYVRLAIDFQNRILGKMDEIDKAMPVLDRFRELTRCAWEVHLSSKELHRVFLYCSRTEFRADLPADILSDMQAVEQASALPLNALVAQGIEQGLFPAKDFELLLFGARSAFWGAIQLVWSGYMGDIDKAVYLSALTEFMLAGLLHQDRVAVATIKAQRARPS